MSPDKEPTIPNIRAKLAREQGLPTEIDPDSLVHQGYTLEEIQGILRWPWRPFCSPTDAAVSEADRMSQFGGLFPKHLLEGTKTAVETDERLRQLGVRLFLAGHITSLSIVGGVDKLVQAMRAWLPNLNLVEPDWVQVEELMLDVCRLKPEQLSQITLFEVSRNLRLATRQRAKQSETLKKTWKPKSVETKPKLVPFTERQREIWELINLQNYTLTDAGRLLGISKQSVSEHHKAAMQKIEQAGKESGLSRQSVMAYLAPNAVKQEGDRD